MCAVSAVKDTFARIICDVHTATMHSLHLCVIFELDGSLDHSLFITHWHSEKAESAFGY